SRRLSVWISRSLLGGGDREGRTQVGSFGNTFELNEVIASGSSASVYACTEKSQGRLLACKMSRREDSRWPWNHVLDLYEREAKLLRHVQGHPNVIQFAGLYKEPNRIYMVMELVNGGDLHTVLTKQRCLPEDAARAAFTQLVSAIDHLHANNVIHRDIKLENVLYDQTQNPPVIKLCDLGNSMLTEQPPSGNFKGTNGYTPPEVQTSSIANWTPKADVWALGVVLYAMLGGYLPFDDSRGRHSATQYLDFSNSAWWDISVEAKLLIQAMLSPAVGDRATLDDVIDSPWLARVDPTRLPKPVAPPTLHPVASMPTVVDVITRCVLAPYMIVLIITIIIIIIAIPPASPFSLSHFFSPFSLSPFFSFFSLLFLSFFLPPFFCRRPP
ncbi:kinase-like domain-containing protein, partial [Pavlovales sp. CCMP2436]